MSLTPSAVPACQLSGHPLDQFTHTHHLVRADVRELYFREGVVQEFFGVSRGVHEVRALNAISGA
jgi:hypothetical protein